MVGVVAEIGLITSILRIANEIVNLAAAAQRNREKCTQLKEFVQMNILLLAELDSQWTPDPVTNKLLENLKAALCDTKSLVESCQNPRTWSRYFKTQKKAMMFEALDLRMTRILAQFHVANMILIVNINKERFFLNVLEKLLRHDACSLLPQSEKEEMKSRIKSLTNTDNMSSDAKRVLKFIITNLTHGDAATTSACSVRPGGPRRVETSTGDDLTAEVLDLAVDIVKKAKALRKNKEEIKQLAEFVQQAVSLMQRPQSSEMSWNPKTRPMVINLKHDLDHAHNIVLHNERNRFTRFIICGISWRQTDEILKVAYKIENDVQVLLAYVITR